MYLNRYLNHLGYKYNYNFHNNLYMLCFQNSGNGYYNDVMMNAHEKKKSKFCWQTFDHNWKYCFSNLIQQLWSQRLHYINCRQSSIHKVSNVVDIFVFFLSVNFLDNASLVISLGIFSTVYEEISLNTPLRTSSIISLRNVKKFIRNDSV